ncbi:MAG: flagellar FlbD family protein [Planctomycetaceae bacterium]|jgi:flagellar protein FlbD|nr:flagellar FlbD family protein [Planctomycetaceae bacterium]
MILLTRLNKDEFILNAELIRYVERCPDTLITLTNGDTVMVRETLDEVVRRVVAYHQSKNLIPKPEYLPYKDKVNSEFGIRNSEL